MGRAGRFGEHRGVDLRIPRQLSHNCRNVSDRAAWLDWLPETVHGLARRWSLTVGAPFEDATCAWVAPVQLADRTPAVLKVAMPHMEGEHEIEGLRFWGGDPTVRLLRADDELGAMLIERCVPGTPLRTLNEPEQDVVIAGLLRRLWREPSASQPFRPLSAMTDGWCEETLADLESWPDAGLVREGLSLLEKLAHGAPTNALLATDLQCG